MADRELGSEATPDGVTDTGVPVFYHPAGYVVQRFGSRYTLTER